MILSRDWITQFVHSNLNPLPPQQHTNDKLHDGNALIVKKKVCNYAICELVTVYPFLSVTIMIVHGVAPHF